MNYCKCCREVNMTNNDGLCPDCEKLQYKGNQMFNQYQRKGLSEMTEWNPDFDMTNVSVSDADKQNGSPKVGDMIARNPKNHEDKWLVAKQYFEDNLELVKDNRFSSFLDLVATERTRQIVEKGYTAEHDDKHTDGWLSQEGVNYAAINIMTYEQRDKDRKQQLVIAATFINAEYERLERLEAKND